MSKKEEKGLSLIVMGRVPSRWLFFLSEKKKKKKGGGGQPFWALPPPLCIPKKGKGFIPKRKEKEKKGALWVPVFRGQLQRGKKKKGNPKAS